MKLSKIFTAFIAICLSINVYSQWSDHFFLGECTYSGVANGNPFAGNEYGFFMLNDNVLEKYTKVNRLSDIDISAVAQNGKMIYVGYSNGNIDIIDTEEYTTVNIPELKSTRNVDNKTIYKFTLSGSSLFCSTECGLLVIDLNRSEIKSRYTIADNIVVNDCAVHDGKIYAATSAGIYYADKSSSILESTDQWTLFDNDSSAYSAITIFNDSVVVARGTAGSSNTIYTLADTTFESKTTVSNFRNFDVRNNSLALVATGTINVVNTDWETETSISEYTIENETYTPNIRYAKFIDDTSFSIADNTLNLVVSDTDGAAKNYLPNGPANNYNYNMTATHGTVYCTAGGPTSAFNNLRRVIAIHIFKEEQWTTASMSSSYDRDAMIVCYDPNNEDSVYISSWGKGIFKVDSLKFTENLNASNSILYDINKNGNFTRVGAISYDNNSNLILANAESVSGLLVKHTDGSWSEISYTPTDNLYNTHKLTFTERGYGWLTILKGDVAGLVVFDMNNTPDDDSDDSYRSVLSTSEDTDSRNCGQLQMWDSDGEIISNKIRAIVEDKNNLLWFGTDDGVVTFSDEKNIFETTYPVFNRIKVPRNDGTDNADYLLGGVIVTDICVDGANRKWIGTSTDGVYLVSSDGLETISSFNVDNSPLPSNEINCIAIEPMSGEVFIGTTYGIVSYLSDAIEESEELSEIKAYPNPVLPTFTGSVKIKGFVDNSIVKITDINGRLVYSTKSLGGLTTWNVKNLDGKRVASGTYLVWASTSDGEESVVCKVLVIK